MKTISVFSLLCIALTSMIGSGWLFGSLYSAHFAGPAAIIAWPLAAFLLLFVALSYAEVATMIPVADALAQLPYYTHGRLTSVILSGLAWISLVTIPVIETQGIIQYASNYLPYLVIQKGIHYHLSFIGYVFAFILLISFVLINYFGVRLFARINTSFTIWKLLIPIITICALLSLSYHPENLYKYDGFMPYGWQGVMAAMSSGGVLFSLLGFRQVVIMMCEIENPGKYVPVVLIISLTFAAILYTALQWSFIGSLRAQDLTHGWANLTFSGDAGPFAALAALAGLIWLSFLLYGDAFISPYSTGLVYSTTASKMLASLGSANDAPQHLALQNKYQVPWVSLLVNFGFAVIMFLFLKNWQAMAAFLVAVLMTSYAVGPICLLSLRQQLPTYPRPFRLRGATIISFFGFYICTAGVYWSGYQSILKMLLLTVVGISLYFMYAYKQNRNFKNLDFKNSIWLLCYLVGMGIFAHFGNYGGIKLFPMFWDLLYLLLFSFVIFSMALACRMPNEFTLSHVPVPLQHQG